MAITPAFSEELAEQYTFANVGYQESAGWKAGSAPDARFVYGQDSPQQFADLRLPSTSKPPNGYPVIVFIHGGAWRSEWSKNYTEAFVEAITQRGFATWDLEFRRLGHDGGGFPGTFEDIADAVDYLRVIADSYSLNLAQVIAVGHSSGGHLALWMAGRHGLSVSSALYRAEPLVLEGVISIAGVNDLELSYELGNRTDVLTLLGIESISADAQRLGQTNPARMLPLGVSQIFMIGNQDDKWRLEMTDRYAKKAEAAGDAIRTIVVPGANHMDIVDARSGIAESVAREARRILQR